jgi:hypothetical protein
MRYIKSYVGYIHFYVIMLRPLSSHKSIIVFYKITVLLLPSSSLSVSKETI